MQKNAMFAPNPIPPTNIDKNIHLNLAAISAGSILFFSGYVVSSVVLAVAVKIGGVCLMIFSGYKLIQLMQDKIQRYKENLAFCKEDLTMNTFFTPAQLEEIEQADALQNYWNQKTPSNALFRIYQKIERIYWRAPIDSLDL